MSTTRRIGFERWGVPYGYEEQEWDLTSQEELQALFQRLAHEPAAVLYMWIDERWLAINISDDLYDLFIQFDEATMFDFVGDPTATDCINYVRGGQLVSHPRRYLTTFDQALRIMQEFYRTGTIDVSAGWDRQGPDNPWWRRCV